MKRIKLIKIKSSLILAVLVLFTSCNAYYKSSVTLEESEKTSGKVKVESQNYGTIKFDKIEKRDDKYFGIIKQQSLELNEEAVTEVHLKNKTKSTILSVLLPVSLILAVFGMTKLGLREKKSDQVFIF